MAVSFLRAHQRGDLAAFDLAHKLPTIAIADQMIRARMLVEYLPAWLDDPIRAFKPWSKRPILVIGAGACGITVAYGLAARRLSVHLIDKAPFVTESPEFERAVNLGEPVAPFGPQFRCRSRWVCPTQYDWPMDHWEMGQFPWNAEAKDRFPFGWSGDLASEIVQEQWLPAFWKLLATYNAAFSRPGRGSVAIRGRTELADPMGKPSFPKNDLRKDSGITLMIRQPEGTERQESFRAVVITTGLGREKMCLGVQEENAPPSSSPFRGFEFWHSDWFERPAFGLPGGRAKQGRVLISGAGDGGLQDLLRVLTGIRSASDIYQDLNIESMLNIDMFHSAERRVERARNWTLGRNFLASYVQEVDRVYHRAVMEMLARAPVIRDRVRDLVAANAPTRTILVSPEPWMGATYGLNRLLAHLLLESLRGTRRVMYLRGWKVESVESDGPNPSDRSPNPYADPEDDPPPYGPAWDCCGHPWLVRLSRVHRRRRWKSASMRDERFIKAGTVILRHGLTGGDPGVSEEDYPLHDVPRPVPPTHLNQFS